MPPQEIKQITRSSHYHQYEIDYTEFADFIKNRPGMIILVPSQSIAGYRSVDTMDIINLLNDFRDATLPERIEPE